MSWYHFSHSNQAEILWEHIKRGSYYDDSTYFPWKVCLLVVRVMVLGSAGQQGLTALAVELSLLRRENQTCSFYREKGLAWAGISSKNIQPPYESLGRGGYRTDVIFNMPSSFPPGWHDSSPPALLAQCVSSESKQFLWMTRSRSMCGTDQNLTPADRRGDAEEGLGAAAKWTGHGASRSWKGLRVKEIDGRVQSGWEMQPCVWEGEGDSGAAPQILIHSSAWFNFICTKGV